MHLRRLRQPDSALRAAFPRGAWLDLRTGDAAADDLAGAECWGRGRRVHAEVITALLLGAYDPQPGHFPAVRLRGARILGRLDLMGATTSYALVCEGCWFEQPPRFVEATTKTVRIIGSHLPSLNGARMRAEGILNLYRSVIDGLLRLDRAHVAGEIFLMGAHIGDGTGEAISAKGLTVEGDMECNDGFTARGSINMGGARIGGRLSFEGAALDGALDLGQLRADELCLRTEQPLTAQLWLGQAHVGTLDDDPAVWPPAVVLNGFTYDSIRHHRGVHVAERLDWVTRDPRGYLPQPYEQLAAYYRRAGHDGDVRRVLLAKQQRRRATLPPAGRVWGRLLDWTVGYGYRPWLAAIWLAILLAAGTTVFTADKPYPVPGGPAPPFNAFTYTLDLLIPIGAFGLRSAYASTGAAQWLADALIAAGWILTAAVIAGVSRALRRD
jgi:hypothetical protein